MMKRFKLFKPNKERYGVCLEFYTGMSTRRIWIDKLANGKWNFEIFVYGLRDTFVFDTLDEVMTALTDEWSMSKSAVPVVREACESIKYTLSEIKTIEVSNDAER